MSSHIGCTKEIYRPSSPNLQISQNKARLTPLENKSQLLFKMQANGGTRKERVHKNTPMSGENWDLGQWRPVGFVKSPVEKGKRRM
jgi:hypothetical protein